MLRSDLEKLPSRMQGLPIDERGYVVPWFVDWIDGKPEFRAMDQRKWLDAIQFKKCWVCGQKMGRFMTFVAGPMCGINRTSPEPPSHLECAQWSARNCPFLNNPEQERRVDSKCPMNPHNVAGFSITRNPGVTMLWTTRTYNVFNDGRDRPLITFGDPESIEWYACGRIAIRSEVEASIESGLPALIAMAQRQDGAMRFLEAAIERFQKYLPAPGVRFVEGAQHK